MYVSVQEYCQTDWYAGIFIRNCGNVPYLHLSCVHQTALVMCVSGDPPKLIHVVGFDTVICVWACPDIVIRELFKTWMVFSGIIFHHESFIMFIAMVVYHDLLVSAKVSST